MNEQKLRDKLLELEKYDTPSITNIVATYPEKEVCLGLYHPWKGKWYTNQDLKCLFPELGPKAGIAVTVTYGLPDPNYNRLSFEDLAVAISNEKLPVILAVKQNFSDEVKRINGLLGGNMMTAFKSLGVIGVLSDGPSRDIDEIRPLGMQYMLTGASAGHGKFAIESINTPVDICDMNIQTGDVIHMDESGAVKFPLKYLDEVLDRVAKLSATEGKRQEMMRKESDPHAIAAIMRGEYD